MLTIEGRSIYIARGKGVSDTVNICDANNRRGEYDWIVRVFKPIEINERDLVAFSQIPQLIQWLRREKKGAVEQEPSNVGDAHTGPVLTNAVTGFDPLKDAWTLEAKWLVDHTLDQLVHEFVEFPFLHRVEHSLHARFFSMLSGQPHFARLFPLGNSGHQTQTIHKEWPETIPREARKHGNFDIAIVAPVQLAASSIEDFRRGRIPAPIVVEMGLDYDAAHLAADEEKLVNSAVQYPYLVHFLRTCVADELVSRILFQPSGYIRTVYAGIRSGTISYKLLDDRAFQSKLFAGQDPE
jgi:hypothetical protein